MNFTTIVPIKKSTVSYILKGVAVLCSLIIVFGFAFGLSLGVLNPILIFSALLSYMGAYVFNEKK